MFVLLTFKPNLFSPNSGHAELVFAHQMTGIWLVVPFPENERGAEEPEE